MVIYFYDGTHLECESIEIGTNCLIVDEYLAVYPEDIIRIVPKRKGDRR